MRCTRRAFLGTAAGAFVMAAERIGPGDGARIQPSVPSSRIRVRKIYLAKPVPTWPTPKLDVGAEIARVEGELAKLAPEIPDIEFIGGELYRKAEDLPADLASRLGDADAVLVFNLTSTVGHLLTPIVRVGRPTILYSQPFSGHDWGTASALAGEGAKVECLATSDWREIIEALRPIRALRRMRESRILWVSGGTGRASIADGVKEFLGTDIATLDRGRLVEAYDAADAAEADAFADRWIRGARQVVEPTREEVVKSGRLWLAMRRILAEEEAQAIAINCLGLFYAGLLPAYPCIGFSQLNNDLFVGACEADLDSTLTMLLFRYLVERPGFISDPVFDTSRNEVIHAHCAAPTRMDGPAGPEAPYVIRSHLEDDRGAALQVQMRVGETITMARFAGPRKILLSTARITGTPVLERGCRTKIATAVPDARKMLEGYRHGLHRVIFYGDHTLAVRRLARFLPGLEIAMEG